MEATNKVIRIAISGPESCGKSTLASALGEYFKTEFIQEYARTYLSEKKTNYTRDDLDLIAEGQFNSIIANQNKIVISDTDFVVLKVWSEDKFNTCSNKINSLVSQNRFDLHILCSPDIPWQDDPLRENPNNRHELFEKYLEVLERYNKDYIIISGNHNDRLKKSITAIESI